MLQLTFGDICLMHCLWWEWVCMMYARMEELHCSSHASAITSKWSKSWCQTVPMSIVRWLMGHLHCLSVHRMDTCEWCSICLAKVPNQAWRERLYKKTVYTVLLWLFCTCTDIMKCIKICLFVVRKCAKICELLRNTGLFCSRYDIL